MTDVETRVAAHYSGQDLLGVIISAAGLPDGTLDAATLEQIDEFHVGGAAATERVLDAMALTPGARLLDIGAGIGGPARRAARRGLDVTGIELTEEFVVLATELSRRSARDDRLRFQQGSALSLPFDNASFDAAMMLHVGMNIADKQTLMTQVLRILRPGGTFAIYDLVRLDDVSLTYPLPWAASPETSFLVPGDTYTSAASIAGLELQKEVSRSDESKAFFATMRAKAIERQSEGLPPPPGIGLVMGQDAAVKLANLAAATMQGHIAPLELHFAKPLREAPRHSDFANRPVS